MLHLPEITPNTKLHWEEECLWIGSTRFDLYDLYENITAAFKEREFIGFYFYNYFDTDCKITNLSVMVILFL